MLYSIHKTGKYPVGILIVKPRRKEMMKKWFLLSMPIIVLVAVLSSYNAYAETLLTEEQALNILMSKIKKDKLYDSWTTLSCLSFLNEEKTKNYIEISIHEKHGGSCPGDPATFPIVDRFRIHRLTKQIQWLEPMEGQWLPYKAVLKERLKR